MLAAVILRHLAILQRTEIGYSGYTPYDQCISSHDIFSICFGVINSVSVYKSSCHAFTDAFHLCKIGYYGKNGLQRASRWLLGGVDALVV